MVRNTSTIQDTNGWHWKFKVNKKESIIPIRNPFQNEVEKIASFFYITNFPNYVDAKRLWLECESYGRIVDAFIPNKRSKAGKRFGFIRFIGVKNEERLASSLASIWIGSYHLFALVARFNRQEKKDVLLKKAVEKSNNVHPTQMEQEGSTEHKKSYASTLHGNGESKVDRQEPKKKQLTLSDQELVQISDSQAIALVKVKRVESINSLYQICKEEGFDNIKIFHIGGLWLWLQFQNVKACNAFKSNNTLKSFFSSVKSVSKNFYVDERMAWVEISGLPLCAWGSNAYKKVASLVGKFMFFENDSSTAISLGRVCVATRQKSFISEVVQVTIHGKEYDVHVQELGSWSINLDDMSQILIQTHM
ncbi:RNA-directed DNA polymerase, eukaryota [Tanacetum coccineum]